MNETCECDGFVQFCKVGSTNCSDPVLSHGSSVCLPTTPLMSLTDYVCYCAKAIHCADEFSPCTCSGLVLFGAETGSWQVVNSTSDSPTKPIMCDKDSLGLADLTRNIPKHCFCSPNIEMWFLTNTPFMSSYHMGYTLAQKVDEQDGFNGRLVHRLCKDATCRKIAPPPDICIFVKVPEKLDIEYCKQKGAILIWNIVDNYVAQPIEAISDTKFDAIIAASKDLAIQTSKVFPDVEVWDVPAHHTNDRGVTADTSRPLKNIGFHFAPENEPDQSLLNATRAFAQTHNLELVIDHYVYTRTEDIASYVDVDHETYARLANTFDVLIIAPKYSDTMRINYKPCTRAAVAWSLGVPVILYPYKSYLEALQFGPYAAFAKSEEEVGGVARARRCSSWWCHSTARW